MAIITLLYGLAVLAVVCISGGLLFLTLQVWQHKKYFKEMGVPYIGAGTVRFLRFLTGKISIPEVEMDLYVTAKAAGSPFVGFSDSFLAPAYYVTDPDLTRNIYVKDFEHFVNRRKFTSEKSDLLLNKMLISLESDNWKGLRSKLSPTFTTGKIKRMFQIFETSSQRMCDYLRKVNGPNGGDYDIGEAYSKFALDVIASCAFGVDSKSFDSEPGTLSEFEEMAQRIQFKFSPLKFVKFLFMVMAPKAADFFGVQPFDLSPQVYFLKVIKDVMKKRRECGERRNDFLQLMMDVQEGLLMEDENSKDSQEVMTGAESHEKSSSTSSSKNPFAAESSSTTYKFEDDDIVANCVTFLIGGIDTTQSLLTFATYQLALNQDIQQKLLEEVRASIDSNGGQLTYDGLLEMNYLDMFINETLRYFSPALRTERLCTKDYKIPGTENVVIKAGQVVVMGTIGMHRDATHYPNPEKFDPERFSPENKKERHSYAFAPFGHGPRNCIGMRFVLIEAKALIATLVHNFKFEPCSQTDIPPKFGNGTSLKPLNGMFLSITPRSEK